MSNDALSPARNLHGSNRAMLLRCTIVVTLVSFLFFLDACSLLGNSASTNKTSSAQSLAISAVLPAAVMGVSYNATFAVSGGTAPYHFTLASGELPSGLLLNATTGTISGMPSKTGSFSFAVSAADSNANSASHSFDVTVSNAGAVAVTVTPVTATVVSAGTAQFAAQVRNTSNVAVTWSASVGTISRTGLFQAPTVSANTDAILTATSLADSTKSGKAVVLVTPAPPLTVSTISLPGATAGVAYSTSFSASGGKAPYSWTATSGTLPAGIALQFSGSLSGTTNQTGQFTFTVQVSDSSSPKQIASRSFTLTVSASTGGGGALPPSTLFGFTDTSTSVKKFPTASYGMQRFWDSPPLQWPSINTASGIYDFTNLDTELATGYTNGVTEGMYTLARTPPWASSNPADTSCHYTTAASGGGLGECDAPSDLNSDGTGSNAIWKAWITAIATHVNGSTYLQSHAHVKYWEILNQPDNQPLWSGSFAQLARLTEDANCIITGRGVIHESGNG